MKKNARRTPQPLNSKRGSPPEVIARYTLLMHAVVRAGVREMAIKGIYLRSKRIKEIYRGGVENQ